MDKLKKAYFKAVSSFWDWRSRTTKDYHLVKGFNAMYLAYLAKYKAIQYRPKKRK